MNDLSFLKEIRGQRILIAPLNWGLGHAARCIPIIRALLPHNDILLGSDGDALSLLIQEFPQLSYVVLQPHDIHYKDKHFLWGMVKQTPKLISTISQEMSLTSDIVDRFGLSMIISDHRLGCRDKRIRSIIIAHQLQIQTDLKAASFMGTKSNRFFINAFDECWIPDYQSKQLRLSGDLAEPNGIKSHKYIGPLSRLTSLDRKTTHDIAIVLSGPEPQRSNIEEKLYRCFEGTCWKTVWVRGSAQKASEGPLKAEEDVHDLVSATTLNQIINQSKLIIARSGYTTIMDMAKLNKKCILIPTPGQTEQEYLMQHLSDRDNFHFLEEHQLDQLEALIPRAIND